MKKFLVLIMVLAITLSLVACGGNNAAPAAAPSTPTQVEKTEFTAEQQALAQAFMDTAAAFDEIADRVNASDELRSDEALITTMNELADEIIAADEHFSSSEKLTPEVMSGLKEAMAAINEFADTSKKALDEIDAAKAALNEGAQPSDAGPKTIETGEGIGTTQPLTDNEINYVISLRTESWLALDLNKKSDVISLIARWWDVVDGYIVEDLDAMLADLDHQMETYHRNKADEGIFQTACDIYGINISHYIMG